MAVCAGAVSDLGAGNIDDIRVKIARVQSDALGRELPVAVVVPAETQGLKPVLFFLHGRGRYHASLLESPAARAALLDADFYVVLPQGEDGWYLDSPVIQEDRYEAYLEEVVAWAESNLPVRRDAAGRGIAGWSMGGYGAVRFAQRHPGDFGFVASVIGLLDFPREETLPEGQNYRVPAERFGNDPATWAELNPLYHIHHLQTGALTLVLSEHGFERTMNERFLAAVVAARQPVRVHRLAGGHEFSVVEAALPLVLADAARAFQLDPIHP